MFPVISCISTHLSAGLVSAARTLRVERCWGNCKGSRVPFSRWGRDNSFSWANHRPYRVSVCFIAGIYLSCICIYIYIYIYTRIYVYILYIWYVSFYVLYVVSFLPLSSTIWSHPQNQLCRTNGAPSVNRSSAKLKLGVVCLLVRTNVVNPCIPNKPSLILP